MNYGSGQAQMNHEIAKESPQPKLFQIASVLDREIAALNECVSRLEERLAPVCQSCPTTGVKDIGPPEQASQFAADLYAKGDRIRILRQRLSVILDTIDL